MVFDTHTHAWTAPTPALPWTNGPLLEDFTSQFSTDIVYRGEDLLADMDAAGVDEAVVVGYPICDWTDNSYTVQVAGAFDRLKGIVMIDPFADDAARTLRETVSRDGVVGFHLGAVCPNDEMWQTFDYEETWLREAIAEEVFWEAALEQDAVVQILVHTSQLDQVLELVETYPELRYTLDHWCHADAAGDPAESLAPLEPLAEYQTVSVKISEIAHLSNEDYPYEDAHDHLRWLLEHLGRERVLWGSDFPNVSHPDFGENTYEETLSWLDHVSFLSDADRRWLLEDAPRAFFEEV
jgi:predicted TIM-barrel fold metal-dependent hydrolase